MTVLRQITTTRNNETHSRAEHPRFFWRGALILLPLALLAAMGIFSLRQDRLLATVEAKERCQGIADNYARAIAAELQKPAPLPFSEITVDSSGHLLAVGGSRSRAVMIDSAVPHPLSENILTPDQRQTWRAAQSAESNESLLKKFIASRPPPPFLTRARYDLALLSGAANKEAAAGLWLDVEKDRAAFSDAGLPLFLLAQYQRWKLGAAPGELLSSNAVEFPTLISPMLLAATANAKWLELWQRDEAARDFYQASRHGDNWIRWRDEDWLVLSHSNSLVAVPQSAVETAMKTAEPSEQQLAPYAQSTVKLAGKEFPSGNPLSPLLAEGVAVVRPGVGVTVSEYLAKPDLLFARARARSEWFAALIVAAAAVALIGFVSAYRGFREQVRLGEMKSNFVSSVSHELRAPIASMRLLAESLERGNIADAVKQKEYFGLLVQESRRLSMLIENILDFSRMDRGGKNYEFEPADIDALTEDTVRLMKPCAAERRVELELRRHAGPRAEPAVCDGLALQQALINLIDNAVKHSSPGGRVVVGLEDGSRSASVWVEDNGPGIPAEEHGKIFERFYRRGSELRRETQGIGIGLTIVKHIVEAHGGRVTVRSAPGEGSRFTIQLPRT